MGIRGINRRYYPCQRKVDVAKDKAIAFQLLWNLLYAEEKIICDSTAILPIVRRFIVPYNPSGHLEFDIEYFFISSFHVGELGRNR